jgi:uncharacterized protein YegP (UPF0339 family)
MFYMYRDDEGNWRWRLVTASNQVLADCATSYARKDDCRAAIQLVKDCRMARVHEVQAAPSAGACL